MKNITVKHTQKTSERKLKLNNGDLILQCNGENEIINAFMVTSFRNNTNNKLWENTANYCSLINLDTGKIQFEEVCSRNTTEYIVLKHLNRQCYNSYRSDFTSYYEDSKEGDRYINIYKKGVYSMEITLGNEKI